MTVYVVMRGDPYDSTLYGVFSSKEKANSAIKSEELLHCDDEAYLILERELDGKLVELYHEIDAEIKRLDELRSLKEKIRI